MPENQKREEDDATVEEREGPSNTPGPNRKTLTQLQAEKVREMTERRVKRLVAHRKAMADVAKLSGWKAPTRTLLKVRPAQQFSVNGVNDEAGGSIIGEVEVERTPWIVRRIRDGSLEVVSESEAPEDEPEANGNGNGGNGGNGNSNSAPRAKKRPAPSEPAQQPEPAPEQQPVEPAPEPIV